MSTDTTPPETPRDMINGVPADQYGLWCRHGKRLMVADPADTSDYPSLVFADPWPCTEPDCTPERLTAEMEAQEASTSYPRSVEHRDLASGASTERKWNR